MRKYISKEVMEEIKYEQTFFLKIIGAICVGGAIGLVLLLILSMIFGE